MNAYGMQYGYGSVAEATGEERAVFIRRTYGHLALAILAFVALEAFLLNVLSPAAIFASVSSKGLILFTVVGFVGVSWLANYWAHSSTSRPLQYAGLFLYVVLEAFIFMPILYVAGTQYPGAITSAAVMTLAVFGGLTLAVLLTRHDFSFLRTALCVGGLLSVGVVLCAIVVGFPLGMWFSFAMVALACGYILYDTSNVLHHYRPDQYVAASLALFASVALLFWYVLRIVMSSRR